MSEQEPESSINPFAVPLSSATLASEDGNPDPPPRPKLLKVFPKWLMICAFAAGPSFFFGGMMGEWRLSAVLGMVVGIFVFVVGYTALEFTTAVQEQMRKPVSRRASWIAYLTRIIISIVYPVGIFVDVMCGIFATGFSSSVTGIYENGLRGGGELAISDDARFFQFIFTTLVQGVLLNLVLFGYMAIVWLICKAISRN